MNRRELFRIGSGAALSGTRKVKGRDFLRLGWARASVRFGGKVVRELLLSVTDETGPVSALTAADFAVLEDGEEREAISVSADYRLPVALALLVRYSRADRASFVAQLKQVREIFLGHSEVPTQCLRAGDNLLLELFGPEFPAVVRHELPIGLSDRAEALMSLYACARELPELLVGTAKGKRETTAADALERAQADLHPHPASAKAIILLQKSSETQILSTISVPVFLASDAAKGEIQRRILNQLRRAYRLVYVGNRAAGAIEVFARGKAPARIIGIHEVSHPLQCAEGGMHKGGFSGAI